MPVRLRLFGAPRLEVDGETHALPLERRNQVLVLAAMRRAWVGRAELAAMLWPDQASKLAYSNVRKTLFRLKALPWAEHIELAENAVRFSAATDVLEFEEALHDGRTADALPLHSDDLLRGFEDDRSDAWSSWLQYERERLRGAWRSAALEHLASELEPAAAIDLSARLLEADPLDEAALRAHMAWLAKGGQAARARKAYREFAERLSEELGLAPGAELSAQHDALGASAPQAVKPPREAAHDDFVGRAIELRRVAETLAQPDCRLVCIVGPGGMGKTRLARRVSLELAPRYSHGAAFISLEDVAAPDQLGGRLARELGLSLAGSAQPMDQVHEFLRDRHMLLVLDNAEDFVAHASHLEKLLQSCPRLKILATSRVRLAIVPEWSFPLEGLPFPEADDRDRAEAFDAVRLFVAAARRVSPGFTTSAEPDAIVDICRQVEGIPLALELAASWTRALSCAEIATQLRRGGELLRTVDTAREARHASLEVIFEQSWNRLSGVERDTLARLSIFRGGFTSDAARAVAGAQLPVLGALVDKSLLRREGGRNALHALIRRLAAGRLEGEARSATEAAHARYFHGLMAQLRRPVESGDRDALARIDSESGNCRAAWRWAVANGQGEMLARSCFTALSFCDHRGRFEEGLAFLTAALDARPPSADPRYEPLIASAIAHLQYRLDRYAEAEATAARALALSRETADHDTRLQCFKVLGACSLRLGKLDEAKRYYEQALEQSPAASDPHNAAAMLDNLALVEKSLGNHEESRRMSMASLVQHRMLRDVAGEALCLNNLASLEVDLGEREAAGAHLAAGLALCDQHGLVATRGLILANLGELAIHMGNLDLAEERLRRAMEIFEQARNRATACYLHVLFARIAVARRDFDAARRELVTCLEHALAIGRRSLLRDGIAGFAELLEAQGDAPAARRLYALARDPESHDLAEAAHRLIVGS